MSERKVVPMQAPQEQPNGQLERSPHLTPVERPEKSHQPAPQEKKPAVSDRTVLLRSQKQYHQSGKCPNVLAFLEVARLVRQRKFISPKHAQYLYEELDRIEEAIALPVEQLAHLTHQLANQVKNQETPMPEQGFEIAETVRQLFDPIDRLTAIARNHLDPPEPGVEEGFALCYMDTVKRVNDLRHSLSHLTEKFRPQQLQQQFTCHPHTDLQRLVLDNTIYELYYAAQVLIPRLRSNIARKVPNLWGSVVEEQE
ncbi:hypothetical protein [Geitlerinema sp. PCC 9228]|uniref:hypothetical protein n=1 Tax=Geitlerinema sp. PCC 9228 TaxID=111611 RepID=UPI001114C05A|nr:hypothetical protein [Geitlerinema sp. PCC 9228]